MAKKGMSRPSPEENQKGITQRKGKRDNPKKVNEVK